jgi:glycosyltransferase involved in cell wall biosynthesis
MTTVDQVSIERHISTADDCRIAVIIPCFNEALAIQKVVEDFIAALPQATIYVYDNNSTDDTAGVARAAGAIVRNVSRQGKGHVVTRMFADIDADIFIMVDGDATYDAARAPLLVSRLRESKLDMVVGTRVHEDDAAYRKGHQLGNWLFSTFIAVVFDAQFKDILSGYRVFARRFVKSFPALSRGFEIEVQLAVHALELGLAVEEVPTAYFPRPAGSVSKLNTWRDGIRILFTIANLCRAERPLAFFSILGGLLTAVAVLLAIPIVVTYLEIGLVPRLPTAVLVTGLMILAFLFGMSGLILDTVTKGRREMKRLAYLQLAVPD